jgi:hypothetical protein
MPVNRPRGPLFHQAHYNVIAKRMREEVEMYVEKKTDYEIGFTNAIVEVSLSLAKTFEKDNPNFDPRHFLDRCSPDPETYPFSELWDYGT